MQQARNQQAPISDTVGPDFRHGQVIYSSQSEGCLAAEPCDCTRLGGRVGSNDRPAADSRGKANHAVGRNILSLHLIGLGGVGGGAAVGLAGGR